MISVSQLSLGNVDEYSQSDASKLNTSQPQYADLASMHASWQLWRLASEYYSPTHYHTKIEP